MILKIIKILKADEDVYVASATGKWKGNLYFFTANMFSAEPQEKSFSHPYEDQKPGNRIEIDEWLLCVPAKELMDGNGISFVEKRK